MIAQISVFVVYSLIAIGVMAMVASEGIDEDGNIYDETAISCGVFIGMLWPLSVLAFTLEIFVTNLGQETTKMKK